MTISIKPTASGSTIEQDGSTILTVDGSGNISTPNTFTSTGAMTGTGGIYLGGTAAANLLDDYEEGTWTPVIYGQTTAGTWTPSGSNGGFYIKVGRLVYLYGNCVGTIAGAAGRAQINGLPFARAGGGGANGNNATYSSICQGYWAGITVNASPFLVNPANFLYAHTRTNTTSSGGTVSITNGAQNVHFAGSYFTD